MQQLERRSDRWVSAGLSILLHGTLIAVLVYGWFSFRHQARTPPSLAIDATIVSSKALNGGVAALHPIAPPRPVEEQTVPQPSTVAPLQTVTPPPRPTPPPPAADDQTVPSPPPKPHPDAAELKAKEAQALAEQKAAAQAKLKQAEREAQEKAHEKAAAQALADRKAKAEAAKKRAEEQQRLAEAKRKAEQKRKAEEQAKLEAQRKLDAERQAAAERRAAEAKALALNQAELQQGVSADEQALAARSGPAMASWVQQITARIQHAWIRPPTARPGIDCTLFVTQVPGGEIVKVTLGPCNGDAAVRQSIQDAAYRASPLPPPPDPTLFERDLQIEFKPTD